MNHPKHEAFSLVELSIVLVILGLLTGGILTGQSLIKAAELRAVSTEFANYQTAVNTFRSKYFALPGDFGKATDFWNPAASCTATAGTNLNPNTCNGDGDGQIDESANSNERFLFWQHLTLSQLIEGNYTGTSGIDSVLHHQPGINNPRSKFPNAGWGIEYYTNAPNTEFFNISYAGNLWEFGSQNGDGDMDRAALTPEEAWNIDTKIDDSKPVQGKVIARRSDITGDCTDAADDNNLEADYLLSQPSILCALIFHNIF